jgi:hypothetical protein
LAWKYISRYTLDNALDHPERKKLEGEPRLAFPLVGADIGSRDIGDDGVASLPI